MYAKSEGFQFHRRKDFSSEDDYRIYRITFQACYNRFITAKNTSLYTYTPPPSIPTSDYSEEQSSFRGIRSAWEKIQEGAKIFWEEIHEEERHPHNEWKWHIPQAKKIKEHIISTFPGMAILHYYYQKRKKSAGER